MKKCTKCSSELKDDPKFCSECGEKNDSQESDKDLSLEDVVAWQDNLIKDIDLNKPDEELSTDERVKKILYNVLDKTVEEGIGKDAKKNLDELRKKESVALNLKDNFHKLIELGKEIEKNLLLQKSYLTIFFDNGEENHYKTANNGIVNEILENKSLTSGERIVLAEKALKLTEAYRSKLLKELTTREEIVNALLPSFDKKIREANFEQYKVITGDNSLDDINENLSRWLVLTKELFPYRSKGVEAVKESLEMDEMVPRLVIEHNGDTSVKSNTAGRNMMMKGDRVVKLTKEADEAESRIDEERMTLSRWLFGNEEEYMDFLKNKETEEIPPSSTEGDGMKWVIVIVLSIIALSGGIWTAIGVFILGMIIINVLSNK